MTPLYVLYNGTFSDSKRTTKVSYTNSYIFSILLDIFLSLRYGNNDESSWDEGEQYLES